MAIVKISRRGGVGRETARSRAGIWARTGPRANVKTLKLWRQANTRQAENTSSQLTLRIEICTEKTFLCATRKKFFFSFFPHAAAAT